MKKIVLTTFAIVAIAVSVVAQPKAIGIRAGGNQELSFQMYTGGYGTNMVQLDFGSYYFTGLQTTLTYNWLSASSDNAFAAYGGFGAAVGFNWGDNDWYPRFMDKQDPNYLTNLANRKALRRYWFTGVVGQIGLEYRFESIPITISVDYRPLLGIEFGKRYFPETKLYSDKKAIMFHTPGIFAFGLSGKYSF